MTFRALHLPLLLGTAAFPAFAAQAQTQDQAQTTTQTQAPLPADQTGTAPDTTQPGAAVDEYGNEEEIVVRGQRARGSVIGSCLRIAA